MRIGLLISVCISIALAEPAKAWWGKYSSLQEARDACDKWSLNGGEYYFKKRNIFGRRDKRSGLEITLTKIQK